MNVQVLGSGCSTCKKLYEIVSQVVVEIDADCTVEYVTGAAGMQEIIRLHSLVSPVLTVNGKIAMTGFTSDRQKIMEIILDKSSKK